jgi:hypothetical protein
MIALIQVHISIRYFVVFRQILFMYIYIYMQEYVYYVYVRKRINKKKNHKKHVFITKLFIF